MAWGPGPRKVAALTHEAGDEHSGDPLLPHLLDLRLLAGRNGGAHNSQCVDVGDGADRRGSEPGQPKQPTEPTQGADQQQVQVEAGAFEQPPRLLADNEPAGRGRKGADGWGGPARRCARRQELSPGPASFLSQVPKLISHLSKLEPNSHTANV